MVLQIHETYLENEADRRNLQSTIEELEQNLNQCKLELTAVSQKYEQTLQAVNVRSETSVPNLNAINYHGHHDEISTNGVSSAAMITNSLARSPATYSFDASGGSGSDTNEYLTNKGDHVSPGCSNYSSITHSSTALEIAERLQEEHLILIEDLKKELKEKQKQVAGLEREKEKISLENQLLSLKYGRRGSQDAAQLESEEDWSKYTTEYYGSKIIDLNVRLQQEQSKSVHYDNECRNLVIRLHNAQECVEQLTASNRALAKEINDVKDEAETTKRNYEEQMRALSEHLTREISNKTDFHTDHKSNSKRSLFR